MYNQIAHDSLYVQRAHRHAAPNIPPPNTLACHISPTSPSSSATTMKPSHSYTRLGFELVEDTVIPEQQKRWVVIRPPSPSPGETATSAPVSQGATILLGRASNAEQEAEGYFCFWRRMIFIGILSIFRRWGWSGCGSPRSKHTGKWLFGRIYMGICGISLQYS